MENQCCVDGEKNWLSEIFRDCDESSRVEIYNNKVKESCE